MGSSTLDILIAGGGICGLSCAIALRRSNHTVRILERSHFKNEVGAAITIPPNASRVLQSWNLDFRKAHMITFEGVELVNGEGVMLARSDFSGSEKIFGAPYLLSHRVDLHEALKDMAISPDGPGKPVEIVNGARIISYDAEAGSVELADGSTLSADLIVAADGVHSIASKFIGTHRPAIPSDNTVVRFLVPTATLLADPATADMISGDGICAVCIPASKTRWLIRYPCRDNKLQNFGFYSFDEAKTTSQELSLKSDRASFLRSLDGFPSSIVAAAAKASELLPLWRCTSREPSSQMFRGRLLLAGDAAHAMLPHLGQGAAQSIEDAAALGILLQGVTKGGSDKTGDSVEARLKLYEEIRKDRVAAIQILSAVPAVEDDFGRVAEKWEKLLPGHEFPRQKIDSYALCAAYDIVKECSALLERSSS